MSLRVHLLYETDRYGNPHGSGQIRLLRPFSHPALADNLRVTSGETFPGDGVDVVVLERGWRADATLQSAGILVEKIREMGATLLYTLDDNLLDLHRGQPWHPFSTDIKRNIVRYFLRQADGVIVSTEILKQRLCNLNPHIRVVENALDERLFLAGSTHAVPQQSSANGKLVIGYMGTHSHLQDLMMVLEPLRAALREYQGNIEFQIVGISADARVLNCFGGLPFRVLDTGGNHFYPDFVPWARKNLRWDLALAPLEDNAFTRCKSDIKFLDYGLLGIPGIYSKVAAYQHSVRHGENGWLCDNTPASWQAALRLALEQTGQRQKIAQGAFTQITQNRLLKDCAAGWKDAIIALVVKKTNRTFS